MKNKRVPVKELVLNQRWSPSDEPGKWPMPILSKEWMSFFRKAKKVEKQEVGLDKALLNYIQTK